MGLLTKKELLPFLGDPQESVRAAVISGLNLALDGEILEALAIKIEDPSIPVRREVAAALGTKRLPEDARQIQILKKLLSDKAIEVRAQSFISLYRLGAQEALPGACEILAQMKNEAKLEFMERLEKQGALMTLLDALAHDRDAGKRRQILEFLGALDAARFKNNLVAALGDPETEVRVAAIHALVPLKDEPEIAKAIAAMTEDPSERIRTAAQWIKLRM